jgi:ABC-type phosphate transport system permease subunit
VALFGVGDHAAAIATIIFATPPMVRLTLLGLKNVPADVVDAGVMNGCGRFQLLFRVLIPTAKRDVLIGVNQVVMQCLAMTVIADGQEVEVAYDGASAEVGWNTIDEFEFISTNVRLEVSNRTDGEMVIADAIRWVHVD